MIYEFECGCGEAWTEARSVKDRSEPSGCKRCGANVAKREVPSRLGGCYGASDWNTQCFNHGLGVGVRNNLHAKKIAKSRDLTEVGNEDVDKSAKTFENDRNKRLDYDISSITNLGDIRTK